MPIDYIEGLARNRGRPCVTPGCPNPRRHLSAVCTSCELNWNRYGNARGRAVLMRDTAPHRAKVSALLTVNATHEGVSAGMEVASAILAQGLRHEVFNDQGYASARFPGSQHVMRLARAAVAADDILVAALGTWAYLRQEPRPRTDREVTFALARAVFALAPSEKRTSWASGQPKTYWLKVNASDLNGFGKLLVERLAPLFALVCQGIDALEAEVAAKKAARRQSLALPLVNSLGVVRRQPRSTYAGLAFGTAASASPAPTS